MRRTDRSWRTIAILVAVAAALSLACADRALSSHYSECKIPAQISVAFKPNVMLVMDYSGSMQSPAYTDMGSLSWGYGNSKVFYYGSTSTPTSSYYYSTGSTYSSSSIYYGLFTSTSYYKYNSTGGYFYVSGDAPDGGSAGDNGTFSTGISGNILNWLLTSRTDAALKALIGGKAYGLDSSGSDCDCENTTDSYCYLSGQGSRRGVSETTSLYAQFYVRPSTWSSSQTAWGASDTWNSSSYMYPKLELILSSNGIYKGQLSTSDSKTSTFTDRYYEIWSFTLTSTTTVSLSLTGTWTGAADYIGIYSSATSTSATASKTGNSRSSYRSATTLSTSLAAGTYYVVVAPASPGTGTTYLGSYSLVSNVDLTASGSDTGKNNGTTVNKSVGVIPNARVRVQIAKADRSGAINDAWSSANWGFIYYNGGYGDGTSQAGRLMVRCGGVDKVAEFSKYLEGKLDSSGATSSTGYPYPYNGTPSGEALNEAMYYFKQSGGINSSMFGLGTAKDPYYTTVSGELKPVTCRKSYVILVSDGVWNGSVDPYKPARTMHAYDLRTDLTDDQTADLYTIFAFAPKTSDDYEQGTRSMKWTAMYGGFFDLTDCTTDYPYPQTAGSSLNSTTSTFPPTKGSCGTTSAAACCKEWTNGTGTRLGWPDNYFEASSGDELASAISTILSQVTQKSASSSAVATVSQQTEEGDLLIRGMFEATPPDDDTVNEGKYLWYGHLEAYWPDSDGYYSFELSPNNSTSRIMCKDKTGTTNCWDAAMPSSLSGPWPSAIADDTIFAAISTSAHSSSGGTYTLPAGRRIFTVKGHDTTIPRTQYRFDTTNITAAGDSTNGDLGLGLDAYTTPTATNKDTLINWVLGTENSNLRTRTDMNGRLWVLGDIVYSTPVVVGPPSLGGVAQNTKAIVSNAEINVVYETTAAKTAGFDKYYLDWRQIPQLKYRDKVVYVGGNDGMVHAVLMAKWYWKPSEDISTGTYITRYGASLNVSSSDETQWTHPDVGKEIWAYIPSNLLTELKTLANAGYAKQTGGTCTHRFMVDLAPRSVEALFHDKLTSTMSTANDKDLDHWPWRTVILGGERGGGDMYFALDVTDPYNPKVLWEYSVLKNLVTTFNISDVDSTVLTAFKSSCSATTFSTCQGPELPSSSCSECVTALSSSSSLWTPFNDGLTEIDATYPGKEQSDKLTTVSLYRTAKKLPMSWSRPVMGRVGLPTGLDLKPCGPSAGASTSCGTASSCSSSSCDTTISGVRNLAFIGGGLRVLDSELDTVFYNNVDNSGTYGSASAANTADSRIWPDFFKQGFRHALFDPFVLALDLETGVNAFRYVWPTVFNAAKSEGYLPTQYRGDSNEYRIPFAMSDPAVIDAWDRADSKIGEDGYTDYVYVGDLNGVLYGIKMNFNPLQDVASGETGIYLDLWKTKPIPLNTSGTTDYASNLFRARLQPFASQPSVALERDTVTDDQHLRVIVAGGKHEDVDGDKTDATDVAKMSLYNVRDKIQLPTVANFTGCTNDSLKNCDKVISGTISYTSPTLSYAVRANCEQSSGWSYSTSTDTRYRCTGESTESSCQYTVNVEDSSASVTGTTTWSGCTWMKADASNSSNDVSDCCESDCTSTATPCWKCVYDLVETGEKVINKPLIAGGVVFFTTYTPFTTSGDVCNGTGMSYLYAFDYMCQRFSDGYRPLSDTASYAIAANSSGSQVSGQRSSLGTGVASQPVLDSTGSYLIIQKSDGTIVKQAVDLQTPATTVRGWREK